MSAASRLRVLRSRPPPPQPPRRVHLRQDRGGQLPQHVEVHRRVPAPELRPRFPPRCRRKLRTTAPGRVSDFQPKAYSAPRPRGAVEKGHSNQVAVTRTCGLCSPWKIRAMARPLGIAPVSPVITAADHQYADSHLLLGRLWIGAGRGAQWIGGGVCKWLGRAGSFCLLGELDEEVLHVSGQKL